tara:strand:- start:77 stop:295 length:219 start_codon:yes stop_codon:yes gene_type:complete
MTMTEKKLGDYINDLQDYITKLGSCECQCCNGEGFTPSQREELKSIYREVMDEYGLLRHPHDNVGTITLGDK